tara:strand:+ start:2447 stop:3187 length:741 start_codon:yes stop_codon:yes gene_type:complete
MNKEQVLKRLRNDEDYYGKFGKQYLSNSDIYCLLNNPLKFQQPYEPSSAFLVGGYFHTAILEPDKLKKYKIIKSTTRNTKTYKEMSGGELCLLQHEVDKIELMKEKLMNNNIIADLITGTDGKPNDYEEPNVKMIEGKMWKGKADIVNHNEGLVIDLKTTSDITKFKSSAWRFNYDSQAYIYSKMFGYEFLFIVVDKTTHQVGVFDCSPQFYESGKDKVKRAVDAYELFFTTEGFDPKQYFISKTL